MAGFQQRISIPHYSRSSSPALSSVVSDERTDPVPELNTRVIDFLQLIRTDVISLLGQEQRGATAAKDLTIGLQTLKSAVDAILSMVEKEKLVVEKERLMAEKEKIKAYTEQVKAETEKIRMMKT